MKPMDGSFSDFSWQNVIKKVLWALLALVLSVLTVYTVFRKGDLSFLELLINLRRASPCWLLPAFLGMFCFISFEGTAIVQILRTLGFSPSPGKGFLYASADIYFSSITPSASGGQPASAYFMHKDGVPGFAVTVALILNLTMYTLAIITIGLLSLLCFPQVFLQFNIACKLMIVFGICAMTALVLIFLMLLKNQHILMRLGNACAVVLYTLHFRRSAAKLRNKLTAAVAGYNECVSILKGKKSLLFRIYALNLLQRGAQILVTVFSFLALGGNLRDSLHIFAVQTYVMLGSNFVPVPGAIGISEYIMFSGYTMFMDADAAYNLAAVSRGISFYVCVAISFFAVVAGYIVIHLKKHKGGSL